MTREVAAMSKLALHIEHFKADQVTGLANHNYYKRGAHDKHSNQDIDPSRSHLNMALIVPENDEKLRKAIKEDIDTRVVGRVTKASVWVSEHILYPPESMTDPEELRKYFMDVLEFYRKQYGAENIKLAVVHMDETTPHIHIDTVPITKTGKLSRKEIYTRNAISQLHTDLAAYLQNRGYDIQRGESTKEKKVKAKTVKQYKAEKDREYNQLVEDYNKLVDDYNDLADQIDQKDQECDKLVKEHNKLLDKVEALESEWDTLKTTVNDLKGQISISNRIKSIESRTSRLNGNEVIYTKDDAKELEKAAEDAIMLQSRLGDWIQLQERTKQDLQSAEFRERAAKLELEKERRLRLQYQDPAKEYERLLQYYQGQGINLWNDDGTEKTLFRVILEAGVYVATGDKILSEEQRKRLAEEEKKMLKMSEFKKTQKNTKKQENQR